MKLTMQAQGARTRLLEFVKRHKGRTQDFAGRRFDETRYPVRNHFGVKAPLFTSFAARYDTLVYGQLLTQAAQFQPAGSKRFIDLGAGSSIPTLMALSEKPDENRRVLAVELDRDALPISRQNATNAGFLDRYSFVNQSIFEFLDNVSHWPTVLPQIVGANPPYVPCPENRDEGYLAINGGPDGMLFLNAIMSTEWPKGTVLALQWSSLTSPDSMIGRIEEEFEVKAVIATYVSSKTYTSSKDVNPYLLDRHNKGEAVFFFDRGDHVQYMIVGTVLVKK